MDHEPPVNEVCQILFQNSSIDHNILMVDQNYCELPLIDLNLLRLEEVKKAKCVKQMVKAAREWGFFQVVNHGIPSRVLDNMHYEEMNVFHQPFKVKAQEKFLNLPERSYRWGNPSATCLRQFSWSEAIHISVNEISSIDGDHHHKSSTTTSLRSAIEEYTTAVGDLAETISVLLAEKIGVQLDYFKENCSRNSSFLRLNRYPPCPYFFSKVFGLIPHTDTDFLTIVYQPQMQGLQLMKEGNWFSVRPNAHALVINIGDLFQALSNNAYKSIEHRVIAPKKEERFSVAYFYSPTDDTVIKSGMKSSIYKEFSYGELKQQNQADVRATGDKVGLPRFLK
ncbi:hypothetical protein ACFE04_024433 [Oxalis oulophora]